MSTPDFYLSRLITYAEDHSLDLLLSGKNVLKKFLSGGDMNYPLEFVLGGSGLSDIEGLNELFPELESQISDGSILFYSSGELQISGNYFILQPEMTKREGERIAELLRLLNSVTSDKLNCELLFLSLTPHSEKYLDPFNVSAEIREGRLRCLSPVTNTNSDMVILKMMEYRIEFGLGLPETLSEEIKNAGIIYTGELITKFRDVLFKTLASLKPSIFLTEMLELGLYQAYFPEFLQLVGVEQMKEYNHKDVFYHTCRVIDNIAGMTDNVWLRFAALVHDIAKPRTKKFIEGTGWTFHGHEVAGARMMKGIFNRLRLPLDKLKYIKLLVKFHLRPIALAKKGVTDSAVRRLMTEMGDYVEDLIVLCRADITSKNLAKVKTYLQNYDLVVERIREVREKDRLRAFRPPVDGEEIMRVCNLKPSRQVGIIKKEIEEAILSGRIENTYEDSLRLLLELKEKYNL